MNRELLKCLEAYNELYKEESIKAELLKTYLRENGTGAFLRCMYPAHFTASAWLLNRTGDKVLLAEHKKLNKLIQPGGHWEKSDQDLFQTALRELKEEIGIGRVSGDHNNIFHIDIHKIPANIHEPGHLHYDITYLFVCEDEKIEINTKELKHAEWYSLEELKKANIEDDALNGMIFKTASVILYERNLNIL